MGTYTTTACTSSRPAQRRCRLLCMLPPLPAAARTSPSWCAPGPPFCAKVLKPALHAAPAARRSKDKPLVVSTPSKFGSGQAAKLRNHWADAASKVWFAGVALSCCGQRARLSHSNCCGCGQAAKLRYHWADAASKVRLLCLIVWVIAGTSKVRLSLSNCCGSGQAAKPHDRWAAAASKVLFL